MIDFFILFCGVYYSFKLRTVDTIITFHVNAAFKYCTGFNISDFTAIAPVCIYIYIYIQWGKKVFSQPPIVQVLPLKKMREACNFHHRYTSTMRDKIRKENPENHIVGFLKNLFANYGGK